jgi:hypothetical protein
MAVRPVVCALAFTTTATAGVDVQVGGGAMLVVLCSHNTSGVHGGGRDNWIFTLKVHARVYYATPK